MGNTPPIVNHLSPFLDYCEIEKGLSNNTQKNYKQYLLLFIGWLNKIGQSKLKPHELTAKLVWDYRLYLARSYKTPGGKYLGKKSQNYYLIDLRALLNYFAEQDIESLPSSKVKLAKQKTEETISFLEVPDIEKMLRIPDISTINGLRDHAIMELFFSSGMRISELLSLNVEQLSFLNDKNPNKTRELSIVGKGKHVRTIFISPRAAEWLRNYLKARRDVFKPLFINLRSKDEDNNSLSARYVHSMISR